MQESSFFKSFPTRLFNDKSLTDLSIRINFIKSNILKNSIFYEYTIAEDERPDTLSFKVYETSKYDWIILIVNDIYDIHTQWPLTTNSLIKFITDKYGSIQEANETIHHYEDADGFVIDFNTYNSIADGQIVTAYQYEFNRNEQKRNIKLVDSTYISQIENELKEAII